MIKSQLVSKNDNFPVILLTDTDVSDDSIAQVVILYLVTDFTSILTIYRIGIIRCNAR